jgi:Tfp pilus assembly protein PilN
MAKIEINLLPRELRKKSQVIAIDKSITYLAAAVVALVLLFVTIGVLQNVRLRNLDGKIAEAQKRTDQLRANIELVDALSQVKDKILQRMSAIETLDRNRSIWVRVMEDLSKRVPEYLWLSVLKEEDSEIVPKTDSAKSPQAAPPISPVQKVTIEGYSYSLNSLAAFLIQLMQSQYFKNMDLQYVKRAEVKDIKTYNFQLVGDLYYLPEVESTGADTAAHELAGTEEQEDSSLILAAGRQ